MFMICLTEGRWIQTVYDIENGLTIELSDFSAALELPEIGGFSAAKLEKHEITTDDFDGTRDVKIVYAKSY